MLKHLAFFSLCAFAAISLTGCPGVACFGVDTCQLQGTWEASVTNGNTTTVTNRMVITDDAFVYSTQTSGFEGTCKVNALTKPKQMDFMITKSWVGIGPLQVVDNTHKTTFGIYAVSKDTLTVQFGDTGNRPAAFDNDKAVTMAHISAN